MPEEILNIRYHIERMILQSLNTSGSIKRAAARLGVSEKKLWEFRRDLGIVKTEGKYFIQDKTKTDGDKHWHSDRLAEVN